MRKDDGVKMGKVTVVAKSAMAIMVNGGTHELSNAWIPNSQIHDDSEVYHVTLPGDTGELVVSEWFAEKRGWV